ncbi:MAG: anthranilate phosphoribosyltransferase, partial [Pyrinomonadaceae bacterium]|nr:anthranilate phosphoribosyltransferase [Pyrinomonadaceae bacterium]
GFHQTLRDNAISINLQTADLIDVCGTGGDGKNTFNISTLTAFVLAGAGFKVAKHGNFSATSGCGSSDVLHFLGIELTNDEAVLRENLETANFCYLHAPLFQPKLKTIAALRKEIGFRTFFNLLGTLLNPARPKFQLIGVAEPFVMRLYRYFLEDSACSFALVNSRDGYDEISLTGAFDVVSNDGAETFYPEDLGFAAINENELGGGENVEQAARQFLEILRGDGTNAQNTVVYANAMFAIKLVKPELSFAECRNLAETSLKTGAAFRAFKTICRN